MNRAIEVKLPIQTKSELNMREHWAAKASRVKKQKEVTKAMLHNHLVGQDFDNCNIKVVFTRLGARKLDTGDNLASAFKAIRDAIASMIGIDDADCCYEWVYQQETAKKPDRGTVIRIEWEDER